MLRRLADGKRNRAIADELHLARRRDVLIWAQRTRALIEYAPKDQGKP